jgi:putative transposase
MTNYRRVYTLGATWFFTVNLAERKWNTLLVDEIEPLRQAFRTVQQRHPFHIDAIVVMPDHLHCIWTLPDGDTDYSMRWNLLKGQFSRSLEKGERVSASRMGKRERGIWQRRFWAHLILDQEDFNRHVEYIHWNPVKHGLATQVVDWPYSSFHHYVRHGVYPAAWGHNGEIDLDAGE